MGTIKLATNVNAVDHGRLFGLADDDHGSTYISKTSVLVYTPTTNYHPATKKYTDDSITTHAAIADAHQTKYTNLEAQTACNLSGNLYWSCSGSHFNVKWPSTALYGYCYQRGKVTASEDGVNFVASVFLPNGATITEAIVYGDAAASAETWNLCKIRLSDTTPANLAGANINTSDITIGGGVIDNSTYHYILSTSDLDTGDEIYGARITYTL